MIEKYNCKLWLSNDQAENNLIVKNYRIQVFLGVWGIMMSANSSMF